MSNKNTDKQILELLQKIDAKLDNKNEKQVETQNEDNSKCSSELVEIPEINIKVQRSYHLKDVLIKDIKIPNGMRLLTASEFFHIYNNHKDKFTDLDKTYEIIQYPIKELREKYPYWDVWFGGLGGDSVLFCGRDLGYGDCWVRGVRFCKDVGGKDVKG